MPVRAVPPLSRGLSDASDADLLVRAQGGDALAVDVMLDRYRRFVRAKARGYFIMGADLDDLVQEGMIGLYKSIRDFRVDREASFRVFAQLCITRQILSAVKSATRLKHRPLNHYVSISGASRGEELSEHTVERLLDDHHAADPAEEIVSSEDMRDMHRSLAAMLSGFEVQVLRLYVEGRSYQEIGERLDRHAKSIDNALQRVKRKLEVHLAEQAACEDEPERAFAVA